MGQYTIKWAELWKSIKWAYSLTEQQRPILIQHDQFVFNYAIPLLPVTFFFSDRNKNEVLGQLLPFAIRFIDEYLRIFLLNNQK